MTKPSAELLQGTLDMLILKALAWGPAHGFGVARWIEQVSNEELRIEEGALYPALHRMHKRRWIDAEWGVSENNRRAKYYQLTPAGRRALQGRISGWESASAAIQRVLQAEGGG
ncbi:MAG: PadR family transcriptional regulator [Planctomycetota bacterium]|jgi:transcriptional regulator